MKTNQRLRKRERKKSERNNLKSHEKPRFSRRENEKKKELKTSPPGNCATSKKLNFHSTAQKPEN